MSEALLDPMHALAAKWDATAARNQRNGQSLIDQGDEYGNEGLAVAEALGACVVELRAVLADAPPKAAPELGGTVTIDGQTFPQATPAPELAAAMAEPRELRKVITELLGMFRAISGGWGARTSSSRLRKLATRAEVTWDEYGRRDAPDTDEAAETRQLREQLELTREQLRNLAAGLELSASATAPSKKSTIESGCAAAVRGIASPPS